MDAVDATSGPVPGNWAVRWLPTAILVLGALAYGAVFVGVGAVPGKGPGFTMYSAADHENTRFTRVVLSLDGSRYPARVPAGLEALRRDLMAFPSEDNARELLDRLMEERWRLDGGWLVVDPTGQAVGLDGELALWTSEIHDGWMTPDELLRVAT